MPDPAAAAPSTMAPTTQNRETDITFLARRSADMFDVRNAVQHVNHALAGKNIAPETVNIVDIVLAEVLNNVVEHALRDMPGGSFELRCRQTNTKLRFYVRDNGHSMPGGTLPSGVPPLIGTEVSTLPEGGWGWSLVTKLAENIRYQRGEQGNLIKFSISMRTTL